MFFKGFDDIAVTIRASGDVDIFISQKDRTFSAKTTYSVRFGPQNLRLADMNKDTNLDVVTGKVFHHRLILSYFVTDHN